MIRVVLSFVRGLRLKFVPKLLYKFIGLMSRREVSVFICRQARQPAAAKRWLAQTRGFLFGDIFQGAVMREAVHPNLAPGPG